MECADASNLDLENVGPRVNGGEVDGFRCTVDELVMNIDKVHFLNKSENLYLLRFSILSIPSLLLCSIHIVIADSHSVSFTF